MVNDWNPYRKSPEYRDKFDGIFRKKSLPKEIRPMVAAGERAAKVLKRMSKKIARDRKKALAILRRVGKGL